MVPLWRGWCRRWDSMKTVTRLYLFECAFCVCFRSMFGFVSCLRSFNVVMMSVECHSTCLRRRCTSDRLLPAMHRLSESLTPLTKCFASKRQRFSERIVRCRNGSHAYHRSVCSAAIRKRKCASNLWMGTRPLSPIRVWYVGMRKCSIEIY